MIFVEFVGLPASGKTTIANGVFSNLTEEAIYPLKQLYEKNWFIRNLHKSRAVIYFSFRNLKTIRVLISLIYKSKQKNKIDNLRLLFNFIFMLSIKDKYKNEKKIVILDEGIIQHIWAVEVNSECGKSYQLFKDIIENIDLTIRVDCKVELIESRMLLRKNNYRHKMFLNNIHRNSKIMDEIIEYFMSQGYLNNLISIRSDNGDMIEKNKDYLSKKISCLIKDNGRK